jgi:glyoxylase-like metal-dependent hydrolase (beta-lactamase superfamily II)
VEVHTIDLDYLGAPGAIASYVITGKHEPIMIETGPANTTDALERGLTEIGLAPKDIPYVFVTHIHFDHAGASGWMAGHGAHVYVHEFGRPHLIDPTRLMSSARRIYGDEMEMRWGTLEPIPAGQVTGLVEGAAIDVGETKLSVMETPGHARHHHAFVLETRGNRIAFTGDAAGTYVEEAPTFISLPTPPPEFELGAWLATIDRLEERGFDRIYPTHFGAVDDVTAHLDRVRTALREHAAFVHDLMDEGADADTIAERYRAWFLAQADDGGLPAEKVGFYVKDTMAAMNVTGMMRYWTKLAAKKAS